MDIENKNFAIVLDLDESHLRTDVESILESSSIPFLSLRSRSVRDFQDHQPKLGDAKILIVTDSQDPDRLLSICQSWRSKTDLAILIPEDSRVDYSNPELLASVKHIIPSSDENECKRDLMSLLRRLTRDPFGVERIVGYGAPVQRFVISNSEQRVWMRDRIHSFVESIAFRVNRPTSIFARFAAEVQDELLMNAIWDANENLRFSDRRKPVELSSSKLVFVEWSFDGRNFAVGVRDGFGSFDFASIDRFIKFASIADRRVVRRVQGDENNVWLGPSMIIERVSSIHIAIDPGKATEIIATFNLSRSPANISQKRRGFSLFEV